MDSSETKTLRLKFGGMDANGEQGLKVGRIASSQTPSNIIECAPKIMDGIPKQQSPRMLWDGTKDFEPPDILTTFRIVFAHNAIRFVGVESPKLIVQRFKVFFSTTELEPRFI
jgi:hypothetical protein